MNQKKEYPFLGTGWSFPPDFSGNGAHLETVSGVDNVHKSVRILLETSLGERIMHDDFGCALKNYVFEPLSSRLINDLNNAIALAIRKYETRVKLNNVSVSQDQTEAGLLHIQLMYTVKSTNSRYNMVFPFYVNDTT
jgi:phage baseplate assembly protein W